MAGLRKSSLILLLAFAAGFALRGQKVRAVIVGVSDYRHDALVNDLHFADDDAQDFYDFLAAKYPSNRQSMVLLKDSKATKRSILNAMKRVFDASYEEDMLIFFFSGHGYNGYFLPHDYDDRTQMLYHKEVRKMFSLSPARRKLVFADACRAGSIKIETNQANTPFGLEAYYEQLKRKKGGVALMLSSRWNQNSVELPRLNNGLFTHHLLKGLRGQADPDGNSEIVIKELYQYVRSKLVEYSKKRQIPIIFGRFSDQMTVVRTH